MTPAAEQWAIRGAAAVVGALLAGDIARATSLGIADSGLWFFAPSAALGIAVALLIARWPDGSRMALLVLFWVFAGVVGDLDWDWQSSRAAATVSVLTFGVGGAVYSQMLLSYPSGRLRDRFERAFIVTAYVVGAAWVSFPLLFEDPRGCAPCLPRVPSLIYTGYSFDLRPVGQAFDAILAALGLAAVLLVLRRLRNTAPGVRRTQLPLMLGGVYAAFAYVGARLADLANFNGLATPLDWLDRVNSLLIPLLILGGIAMIRASRGPLGNLVVKLASTPAGSVRDALADALGDPTLELALWVPARNAYVDEAGVEVERPVTSPGRSLTVIGPDAEPLAALVHDEGLAAQRPFIEAAGSAARLALENARLQAELRAQVNELRASRTRIVTAADSERRRLERDLHDGAQQRLLAVGLALEMMTTEPNGGGYRLLAEAQAELQRALAELRDFARGIHPAILTEQGLAPAIRSLADRAPFKLEVKIDETARPAAVEAAAYFVVSEALANAAKHAEAQRVMVRIENADRRLLVTIRDDGRGGASVCPGGGLQGLADRVGALNGELNVTSLKGAGTTIRAAIPCASS